MRPPNYIDKISLLLNPLFINKDCKKTHIDPYNRLILRHVYSKTILIIKQEYFNPFIDHQVQIAGAIYELIKQGIIDFPDNALTPLFIYKFHEYFIHNVTGIEFYCSWEEDEIEINKDMFKYNLEEAKENDCLYRFKNEDGNLTNTYYSNDKALNSYDRSSFIVYDKQKKDLEENQIPKDVIMAYGKPIRTEFRLYSDNTPWLHWDNLKGDYQDIFNRHIKLLATIYNNYVSECITVSSKTNKGFNKIIKEAEKSNPIRYTGGQLKKRKPIKGNKKQEMVLNELSRFTSKSENMEKAQSIQEAIGIMAKSRGKYYRNEDKS